MFVLIALSFLGGVRCWSSGNGLMKPVSPSSREGGILRTTPYATASTGKRDR